MTRVTKEMSFCGAHTLPGHDLCGNLHGHNYKVEVTFQSNEIEDMVIDFKEIKEVCAPVLKEVDHTLLNDSMGLNMPTAENMARWLFIEFRKRLCDGTPEGKVRCSKLFEVAVWETPTSVARYRCEG